MEPLPAAGSFAPSCCAGAPEIQQGGCETGNCYSAGRVWDWDEITTDIKYGPEETWMRPLEFHSYVTITQDQHYFRIRRPPSWISYFWLHRRVWMIVPVVFGDWQNGCSLWIFTPILWASRDMSTSVLAAVIIDSHFRLHQTRLNIVSLTGGPQKMDGSVGIFSPIQSASWDMSISGLVAAIFDSPSRLRQVVLLIVPPTQMTQALWHVCPEFIFSVISEFGPLLTVEGENSENVAEYCI
jgi:hypothetical protein